MKRPLIRSGAFVRSAKRLLRKHPETAQDFLSVLELLSEDVFHPQLKTHRLKGGLEGLWAATVGYDIRIIFQLVDYHGSEAILLMTVRTHDEVY